MALLISTRCSVYNLGVLTKKEGGGLFPHPPPFAIILVPRYTAWPS